jgi:deoxyadenosine/deoxycytidine kinase
MVHLNGWLRVLETERGDRCTVVLLDHGPIYMLASLREFALSVRQNEVFRSWWDERLAHWAYSLDLVVWLDASNEVLEERINRRDHPHLVKGRPQPEIHEFLTRYRSSFENTVSRAVAVNRRLDVHRLRTEAETPENISAMIASGIQSQLKQIPSD